MKTEVGLSDEELGVSENLNYHIYVKAAANWNLSRSIDISTKVRRSLCLFLSMMSKI